MNKRLVVRLLIMLLVAGVLFGGLLGVKSFGNKKMNEIFDNMPVPPSVVESAEARVVSWPNEIRASGTLVAVNGVDVTPEVGGKVVALHFDSGQRVERGDLMLELDSSTERADLANLQAQARLAELELKRLDKLFGLDTISRSQLDQAAAAAESARAQVQAQQARIALKSIRAPFAGELGLRQVNLGEFIASGTRIVSLQALDPIFVDFAVPEQQLARISPGLRVQLSTESVSGQTFTGEIQAVSPQVDVATRNFVVRAKLSNSERRLRPGGFADVRVQLGGQRETVAVPRTAVAYNPYGDTVFVIVEREGALTVSSRVVRTGESLGDWVEIRDGVQPGEVLAASGLFRLRNGASVVIDNKDATPPEFAPVVNNR